jgi:hypothetical protein
VRDAFVRESRRPSDGKKADCSALAPLAKSTSASIWTQVFLQSHTDTSHILFHFVFFSLSPASVFVRLVDGSRVFCAAQLIAVKQISLEGHQPKDIEPIQTEVRLLRGLRHESIALWIVYVYV